LLVSRAAPDRCALEPSAPPRAAFRRLPERGRLVSKSLAQIRVDDRHRSGNGEPLRLAERASGAPAPNTEDMPVGAPYSFASPCQFQEHGAADVLAFASSRPLPRISSSPSLLADWPGFLVMPLLDRLACLGAGHLRRCAIFFMER
jgi:hypothetical protein